MKIVSSQTGEDLFNYTFRLEKIKRKMFHNMQKSGYMLPVKMLTEIRRKITWADNIDTAFRIIDSYVVLTDSNKHHIKRYAKFYHANKFLFDKVREVSLECISRELTGYEKLRLRLKYYKQLKAMKAKKKGDISWI